MPVLPEYVYLHYPLCRHTCSYCDFNVYTASKYEGFSDIWLKGIERDLTTFSGGEASSSGPAQAKLRSLYLGGGTPSLLEPKEIERLVGIIEKFYSARSSDFEFTIECNPESLTEQKLRDFKKLGINRVSLGIQSFSEIELKRLERLSTRAHLLNALEWTSKYFKNFTVDLMLGIPDQIKNQLDQNLSEALEFNPPHLSLYLLTIANDHLWKTNSFMKKHLNSDESAREFYLASTYLLESKGYEHYEVSNFSKPGFRSRHNSNYWNIKSSYLGLGPGAHGYLPSTSRRRYEMIRDPQEWSRDETGVSWTEDLSVEQTRLEEFYFKLRTRQPICLTESPDVLKALVNDAVLQPTENDHYILSDNGWLLIESVAARLLQCAKNI